MNHRPITWEEWKHSLPKNGFFYDKSWLFAPEPYSISTSQFHELEKIGNILLKFIRSCDLLYRQSVHGDQPKWIAELLDQGKPEYLIELGRHKKFRNQIPKIIRPDLLLTDSGFSICELDQIPGGIGFTSWLNQFFVRHGYSIVGGEDGMLDGFHSILPGGTILISEESSTYRPEMEYLVSMLNSWSKKNKHDVSWKLVSTSHEENFTGNFYRFFELFDLEQIVCSERLFQLSLEGEVNLTPPPKPALEEKLWMALFWLAPLKGFWLRHLGEYGMKKLSQLIPYTWILTPDSLPPYAVYPKLEIQSWNELANFSQSQRDLIIKISGFHPTCWGSRGVYLGSDMSKQEWKKIVSDALISFPSSPYILQNFRASIKKEQTYYTHEGKVSSLLGRTRLSPYYFVNDEQTKLGGMLATICDSDKKILHGMNESILLPVQISSI